MIIAGINLGYLVARYFSRVSINLAPYEWSSPTGRRIVTYFLPE